MSGNSDTEPDGPFHPKSLVIEADLTSPTRYLRFAPERYPGAWVHDPEEFDHSLDREAVIARSALPEADGSRSSRSRPGSRSRSAALQPSPTSTAAAT